MTSLDSSARGADKYSAVATEIRRRIATGHLQPGSQLPQRTELEEMFQVSKVTLQRAMNLLIEDGFIDATRRKGSFVSARPPHLSRYALAFQGQANPNIHLSQFWVALANECARREREEQCALPIYYGIDGHTDTPAFEKLNREVHEHWLAGVIFVPNYSHPPDLSWILNASLPCVVVQDGAEPQAPTIAVGQRLFLLRALDYVASKGCRRVAFLRHSGDLAGEFNLEFLMPEIEARGLETRPFWTQGVSLQDPIAARNCMHLLMQSGQSERPDALIITDDNLVEFGTLGLVDAGIKPSGDITVVAHTNFPWKTQSYVEVQRLGYDVHQLLSACIESIDCQRQGEDVPPFTELPALFEPEIFNNRRSGSNFSG